MFIDTRELYKERLISYTEYQVFGIEAVDFVRYNTIGGINATIWV